MGDFMKGSVKKTFLILLFLASLFVMPQNTHAKGSDARIDGQYPMGVASDYMMVAGNRFRNTGDDVLAGRFMANSMAFQKADFNSSGIWSNILNASKSEQDSTFYENLWNPAVIINDFTKEDSITDPTLTSSSKTLVTNIAGMWPYKTETSPYTIYPESQNRVRFITDTSKTDVENAVDSDTKKLVDTIWKNNLDTKTEDGQTISGLGDLSQFKDNNITKYLTKKNVPGRSVEDDIEDVSDYYNSLAPGNDDASSFYSSDSRIIDDNKENPQYIAEDYSTIGSVVINIKANPDTDLSGGKPVVSATIDKQKLIEAVKNAGNSSTNLAGVNILFNFSKEFYNADGHLNPKKIPYIVLNYKGFSHDGKLGQFVWDYQDTFGTGEVKDGKLVNKKLMYEALGVEKGDWKNDQVLWFGSQVLNNFTDAYDTDRKSDDVSDLAGLGSSAAVYFKSSNSLMYGSFIIPHGSFYAVNGSNGAFVGGVTAANNITIDQSPISPDQNDGAFGVFGRKENGGSSDFPTLNNPGDQLPDVDPAISSVDLTNGSTQAITNKDETATFDYKMANYMNFLSQVLQQKFMLRMLLISLACIIS